MRSKDPDLMKRIGDYVGDYYRQHHKSPSANTIAQAFKIAKTTAYNYLVAMDERGLLAYDGKSIETAKVEKSRIDYFSAPLVGSVKCGDPELEEESVEQYVSLPVSIFGKGDSYLLRASGDSMVDAGIFSGSLILIRKQTECSVGDIVVALDDNGENTLKRYSGIDEDGYAVLEYMNKAVYGDKTIRVKQLTVQGVAKHVITEL